MKSSKNAPHKSEMVDRRHLEKSKNFSMSATVRLILTKFGMLMPSALCRPLKFPRFKIEDGGRIAAILKNNKMPYLNNMLSHQLFDRF